MSNLAYLFHTTNSKAFLSILQRFFLIVLRNKTSYFNAILFYLIAIAVFHIAVGPYELSPLVAVGIIIVTQIFVLMLNAEKLLREDHRTGTLEQFYILGINFEVMLLAKVLGFCLLYCVTSLFIIPLSMLLFHLDINLLLVLIGASFFIIINSSLLLIFCEALTIHAKSQALLIVLILPLLIPVLILATLAVQNINYLFLLLGLTLINLPIFIIATKAALKVGFEIV